MTHEFEDDHGFDFRRPKASAATKKKSERQTFGRKRGKTPQQFNGIHRRRKKKIRW